MSKKVSELTKELDIKFEELKVYTDKMGINITSAKDSVEDFDANRIISTINLMKGSKSDAGSSAAKPKIKATPVINKDTAKKSPMGKPVIPKKAVVPPKKAEEPAKDEEPEKAEPAAEEPAPAEKPAEKPVPAEEKAAPAETETPEQKQEETSAASEPEKVSEPAPSVIQRSVRTAHVTRRLRHKRCCSLHRY